MPQNIKLTNYLGTQTYEQGSFLQVQSDRAFYSTKPGQTRGKWYFEITYHNGVAHSYAGLRSGIYGLHYYRCCGSTAVSKLLYYNASCYQPAFNLVNFTNDLSTIGVGIDIDSYTLLYISGNESISFKLSLKDDNGLPKKWTFIAAPGNEITDDNISINFGALSFKYKIPEGYTPWNSNLQPITCKTRNSYKVSLLFTIGLIKH